MIQITDLIEKDTVLTNLKTDDKIGALNALIHSLKVEPKQQEAIRKAVFEREEIISTGVGNGIAIPHCKVDVLNKHYGAVAILDEAKPFESIDGKPVSILFLLASPDCNGGGEHLSLLSRISRTLNSRSFRQKLITLKSSRAVIEAFNQEETKYSI